MSEDKIGPEDVEKIIKHVGGPDDPKGLKTAARVRNADMKADSLAHRAVQKAAEDAAPVPKGKFSDLIKEGGDEK